MKTMKLQKTLIYNAVFWSALFLISLLTHFYFGEIVFGIIACAYLIYSVINKIIGE